MASGRREAISVHLFLQTVQGARPEGAEDEESRDHPPHLQRYEQGGEDARFDKKFLFERVLQVLRIVDDQDVPLPDDPFQEGSGVIVAAAPAEAERDGGEDVQDDDVIRGLLLNSHDHGDIKGDIFPELSTGRHGEVRCSADWNRGSCRCR